MAGKARGTRDGDRAPDEGASAHGAHTPVMRQYLAAKAQYPDALLFFRLGDFYELFFDDAVTAARVLDLTLTSRNKQADDSIPMAGVPHHAASGYLQRLVDAGYSVALCEQMADPSTVKGIVPREVVRVVTPAMPYDEAGVDGRANLFLAAVEVGPSGSGIAALDATTGELHAFVGGDDDGTLAELARLEPRELIVGGDSGERLRASLESRLARCVIRQAAPRLSLTEIDAAMEALPSEARVAAEALGPIARAALARCVELVRVCEPGRPSFPFGSLAVHELSTVLALDESTQRHLELVRTLDGERRGSLLAEIDQTVTSGGARMLRARLLAPLTVVDSIRRRHDAVDTFLRHPRARGELRTELAEVSDLERIVTRVGVRRATPRDLAHLRRSLRGVLAAEAVLATIPERDALTAELGEGATLVPDPCAALAEALDRMLAEEVPIKLGDGPTFADGADSALDEARALARDGHALIASLEARLQAESKIASLKVRYTRVFGWYVEVSKTQVAKAPASWRRKQTVASGERFACAELDDLADKLAHAEEARSSRERELFDQLVDEIARASSPLRALSQRVAALDVAAALAELAHRNDYTRPEVDASTTLALVDARHPVVERLAAAGRFVPNDVALDAGGGYSGRLWVLTGPNMSGKSTFMRQAALIVVLAQMGSFVPARSARVGVVDRVLTRVGASDNLARGDSTFMVEMRETAHVLRRATGRSLVILDEIGRGTSTYDGLAIAWAVAEHLHDQVGCRAMFATHYHELTELADLCAGVRNYSVSAKEHEGAIVFFHRVVQGPASQSYGVACARLAGVPEPVVARARAILDKLEAGRGGERSKASVMASAPGSERQLGLFDGRRDAGGEALDALRSLDIDRLTPLEALNELSRLKLLDTRER